MSKALFRFLRGELNGFYIRNLHQSVNEYTKDIKDFLAETKNQQFELDKIDTSSIYGIGTFAGIFLPRVTKAESSASLRMTDSHIKNEEECSQSGLFETSTETFLFPDFTGDINNLATEEQRSSLVGEETIIGYISSTEQNVLDENGKVRKEVILAEPPENVAYSEYYGDQFVFLSEAETTYEKLESSLYIELYKAIQWVRYNGASIKSLCKIINIICPDGLVKIEKIEVASDKKHYNIYYNFDETVDVNYKQQRLNMLEYIVNMKFAQVQLVENI